jgi:hypothetical protein
MRSIPYNEQELPQRMMDLTENVDPRCTVSRSERQLPSREMPYTEREEPRRARFLRLIEDPNMKVSKSETLDPM